MINMLKSTISSFVGNITGSQRKRELEVLKALLQEIRRDQKIHIAVQRKQNERIMTIEYQLDKLSKNS